MKIWIAILISLIGFHIDAEEMDAQQVLQRALDAIGGRQKLGQIQTRSASGKVQVRGLTGTYELWNKAPDKMKLMLDLGVMKQERGYDGKKGWVKQAAIVDQQGADLQRIKRSAIFQPLLFYASSGTPVQLKGKDSINGKNAYVLEFSPTRGSLEQFYIDTQNFLLIREARQIPTTEGGAEQVVIDYSDYRAVEDGVKFPFSFTQTQPGQILSVKFDHHKLNVPLEDRFFQNPSEQYAGKPYEIVISTIPHHVYKENDGLWDPGSTESFYFRLVVNEKYSRTVAPVSATVELYSESGLLKTIRFSDAALGAIRSVSLGGFSNVQEVFDLTHSFTEPISPEVTRIGYTLELQTPEGSKLEKKLEFPVERYVQKTRLIFPLKGNFMVAGGHDFNEPHSQEWSQHYAYDIVGLGPDYELAKNDGKTNEDFQMWGREILAPADGIVVFARNDVPDNKKPGTIDSTVFMSLPDPMQAVGGNNVVIDHGNGEFSLLGHMQMGSVRVKKGDRVKQGHVIGKLGNSGNSDGPHLHYHLMACETIFRCDGLPSQFENLQDFFTGQPLKAKIPKRGIFLTSK